MKSRLLIAFRAAVLPIAMFLTAITNVHAATVNYTLDNIFLDADNQMTGTFEWTYNEGDFENGTGVFSELFIPFTTRTLDELNITFDIKKSIEITLIANLDSDGVDISLVFDNALTPTQSTLLNLDTFNGSKWSLGGTGAHNAFISGGVSPEVAAVPVPAVIWLFGSGLLGLVGVAVRKKA